MPLVHSITYPRLVVQSPDRWLMHACEVGIKARELHLRKALIALSGAPLEVIDPHYPSAVFRVWGNSAEVYVEVSDPEFPNADQ